MSKLSKDITELDYNNYIKLINTGLSQRKSCKQLGIERTKMQRYLKRQSSEVKVGDQSVLSKPKICYLDIEKTFNISGHFNAWGQDLKQTSKFKESHILSYCFAFNDDTEIKGSILTGKELKDDFLKCLETGNTHTSIDELLTLELWSPFNNSDVIVAYNGRGFDVKEINARFLYYGLPVPSPYKVIDPLLIVKNKFRLPFKSLKYVAEFLGVTQKLDNSGNDMWKRASLGDQEALDEMYKYNEYDVIVLREVYKKVQGWGNSGTNLALYSDHGAKCPCCSSDDVTALTDKFSYTSARKYQAYRCVDCGATLRSNKAEGKGNSLVLVI